MNSFFKQISHLIIVKADPTNNIQEFMIQREIPKMKNNKTKSLCYKCTKSERDDHTEQTMCEERVTQTICLPDRATPQLGLFIDDVTPVRALQYKSPNKTQFKMHL